MGPAGADGVARLRRWWTDPTSQTVGRGGPWTPRIAVQLAVLAAAAFIYVTAEILPVGALPAMRCGLIETARAVRYLALESAGQCGPCLNGLPRIAAALAELSRPGNPGHRKQTRADLERWSGLVTGRGACHHPDGSVRFVRSALTTFAPEITRHARGQCASTNRAPFLPVPEGMPESEDDWT